MAKHISKTKDKIRRHLLRFFVNERPKSYRSCKKTSCLRFLTYGLVIKLHGVRNDSKTFDGSYFDFSIRLVISKKYDLILSCFEKNGHFLSFNHVIKIWLFGIRWRNGKKCDGDFLPILPNKSQIMSLLVN